MTSSLVGSEMCIRDSDERTSNAVSTEVGNRRSTFHRSHDIRSYRHGANRCLLYTSDAADDM
eukprot:2851372-Prorocentrum_lima.AAC.1